MYTPNNNQSGIFSKLNKYSKTMSNIILNDEDDFKEIEFYQQQERKIEQNKEIYEVAKQHQYITNPTITKFPTSDSITNTLNELNQPQTNYQPTNIILFKGVPFDCTENDIINLVRRFGIIIDLYQIKHKQYAFVQFKEFSSAIACYKAFNKYKPQIKKNTLHVFFTGKNTIIKSNGLSSPSSRFLLIVFQKTLIKIDQNFIYNVLSPYGHCNKMYLFKKGFIQALIEMEDIGQAILIKDHLDGANIRDQAIISVLYIDQNDFLTYEEEIQMEENILYNFSSLDINGDSDISIKNNHNNNNNISINYCNDTKPLKNSLNDKISDDQICKAFLSNTSTLTDIHTNIKDGFFSRQTSQNDLSECKVDIDIHQMCNNNGSQQSSLIRNLGNEMKNSGTFTNNNSIVLNDDNIQNSFYSIYPRQYQHYHHHQQQQQGDILSSFDEENNNKYYTYQNLNEKLNNNTNNYIRVNQITYNYENRIEKNRKKYTQPQPQPLSSSSSSIAIKPKILKTDNNQIWIKNIPFGITPLLIFKLFGMYGNVQKVIILQNFPNCAIVEYEDQTQVLLVKMYLNNCPIYGKNITVTINNQDYTDEFNHNNDQIIDFSESKDHRYKIMGSKNYNNIAGPSKVLHLSNLCYDKDEYFYRNLFKNYGNIVKMYEMKGESKMYLMEMKNIDDAVSILMNFHNFDIEGKYLKISFSKYQKIKEQAIILKLKKSSFS